MTLDFLKLHYRIMESYQFGFTFDEEGEPKQHFDVALKNCFMNHLNMNDRLKYELLVFDVVPLFIEINEFAGRYPKNAVYQVEKIVRKRRSIFN